MQGKNIIVGITGGIATYKIADLVRYFVKVGANVDVIMTKSAQEFIAPLTLSVLSKNKVHVDTFEKLNEYDVNHIALADKADAFVIAPATANIIGKIANGIADDILSTVVMATKSKVFIAPAMNVNMWTNPTLQANIEKLRALGYIIITPEKGELACGYSGEGRLPDVKTIFDQIKSELESGKPLKNTKILVTAGGTRESIDPVRYLGNRSSGKMGLAIAKCAKLMGANVTVISTVPCDIDGVRVVNVETALEMQDALREMFPENHILIMAAAVADYKIKEYSPSKIKKNHEKNELTLELVKNPDLLADIASSKREDQFIVGFAAETENIYTNAHNKMLKKNIDMILANDVSLKDTGIASDFNAIRIFSIDGSSLDLPRDTKYNIAKSFLDFLLKKISSC